MRGMGDGRDDLVERHQEDVGIPHDGAIAGIAARADDEAEIGGYDFVDRRHDATAVLGVAPVQERQVRRIETALDTLQPIAFLDMARDEALFGWNLCPLEIGKFRLELGRSHIGPHHRAALDARISARLELGLDTRDRLFAHLRHAGDIHARPVHIEFETVIHATQTTLFVAAEEERGGAMRTALVDQADLAARVAEENEIFAQEAYTNRRRVGHRDLV
jgi:hypothetical protein